MRFIIVTGMSGAGKVTALRILEDLGFFCVDNFPMELLEGFTALVNENRDRFSKVAVSIDIRNGDKIDLFQSIFKNKETKHEYEILYLDASDESLMKRFKETRRTHPLSQEDSIEVGIQHERESLAFLRDKADYIIDTSHLLVRELRNTMSDIFLDGKKFNNLQITIQSFGFKYGMPSEADLMFDVRFLPNPYYIDELKHLTGNDKEVYTYVESFDVTKIFLDKLVDLLRFLIPNYINEGKNQLVIAIGCTGGKHRSVTIANALFDTLSESSYGIKVEHRDILK